VGNKRIKFRGVPLLLSIIFTNAAPEAESAVWGNIAGASPMSQIKHKNKKKRRS
jgi:hypothetical protein